MPVIVILKKAIRMTNDLTGNLLIDGSGIRELQLWAGGQALDDAFSDITQLAGECRFRDCSHANEPGCSVLAAIAMGGLEVSRLDHWRQMQLEVKRHEIRCNVVLQREQGRGFGRLYQAVQKEKKKSKCRY